LEYRQLLDDVEAVERVVIGRCAEFVKQAKEVVSSQTGLQLEDTSNEHEPLIHPGPAAQIQVGALSHEIAYNEALIQEREAEIENIARASELVQELFQNVGVIVSEQQGLIGTKCRNSRGPCYLLTDWLTDWLDADNIEANAEMTASHTKRATHHIATTHQQHKRRTSRLCFFILLAVLFALFLLALVNSLL
jgi:hypothetical protein